ncbi:hypothetical protein A4A49_05825 [Nicotiana attenuata]|uniref:Uncharacterized protein n=1 Tax=Nicotiana attenuata TaxID=49451 RepID=A0A1J6IUY7_NICAT|nr:hypothetical protein A4A49_05825 [Nicotiana attenuata]
MEPAAPQAQKKDVAGECIFTVMMLVFPVIVFRSANSLIFGDYPDVMKRNLRKLIKGAIDFIALNHYMTVHVTDSSSSLETDIRDFSADATFSICMCIEKN